MKWRPFALLGGSVLCGCSLLTSLDDLGPAGSDGGTDGATSKDSSGTADADGGAGGNLVTNPSFDQGQGGCGTDWGNGYNETFTRVSPGRMSADACEVCLQTGGTGSYQINYIGSIPVTAGSYYAEAWLATPDGGVSTPSRPETGTPRPRRSSSRGAVHSRSTFIPTRR